MLLLGLLLPARAFADARMEARRHFQNGMALIAHHDFTRGIAELERAYAIKPHPNVLYNIARAYADAGMTKKAVVEFQRYLEWDPPDAAKVVRTIAHLRATLPRPKPEPAPEPPAKVVSAQHSTGLEAQQLSRLEHLADRLQSLLEQAKRAPRPTAPSSAVAKPQALMTPDASALSATPYEEEVVTASRFAQSTLQAPSATTVITHDEIQHSGARTLVELLRRVPGAQVMRLGTASADVSFRGFNQRTANKVLLLIDGRPMYQDFLGIVLWPELPIDLDEIERIEVIRGPASALYGANAALGVINVITRSPGSGPSAVFETTAGSGDSLAGAFVASGGKTLRYRASVGYGQADKWTRDYASKRSDYVPQYSDDALGLRSAHGNLALAYRASPSVELTAGAGVNRFFTEIYPPGVLRNYGLDVTSAYAKGGVHTGPFELKLFWNHLDGRAGPQYAPIGERSLATDLSSNVLDAQALWSHTFRLAGEHKLQVGLESRLKRVDWDYLGPKLHQEIHWAAFAQDEWTPSPPFRVLLSYRIDRHPLLDDGEPGYAQSPRVSFVWLPTKAQAFRASFATAFREPTFLESYTFLRFPIPGVNGATALTTGDVTLQPERFTTGELGYRGEAAALALDWEASAYFTQVKNLIVLSPLTPAPASASFDPTSGSYVIGTSRFQNDPTLYRSMGLELGAKWSPVDRVDLIASASFQHITAQNAPTGQACAPCSEAPAVELFASAAYRSPVHLSFEVEAAYTSATDWIEREPDPTSPTEIAFAGHPLAPYLVLDARIAYQMLGDHLTVALEGTDLGAPHREHPFGNLITRRFFATVTVKP